MNRVYFHNGHIIPSPGGALVMFDEADACVKRLTAEREALQLRLNAVEEENDRLRADAERYQWMKASVRNGSFGTDTGWIDDDTENWDCDIDLKRGVIQMEWDQEI